MYRLSRTPSLIISLDRITLGSVLPDSDDQNRPEADRSGPHHARPAADNPWRLAREYRHAGVQTLLRTSSASPTELNSNKCTNEKILHYSDLNDNVEFEKLVINTADYSSASSDISSIFSDISSSDTECKSTDHKFISFYSPPVCCIEINKEFEKFLLRMDLDSRKSDHMLIQHPELEPIHRSFILDWIMEMCDYFGSSRDTYYQAMCYLDRYFLVSFNLSKEKLQLVGLTCLYLASKWEGSEAINLERLLTLADGMFSNEDLLATERNILVALDYRSIFWTLNKWVFTLLHKVKYMLSLHEYTQITLLLDLVTLDIESLKFSHSVLASACIFQVTSLFIAFPENSTLQHLEICQCIFWSEKYWNAIRESPLSECQMKKLSSHHQTCKFILYSVQQFYHKLLEMFIDLNKEAIINTI